MSSAEETVTEEQSETELAHGLRAGDREAVAVLFDRHAERIYQHCFRLTADRADAEDAMAATFLEVWRHRERIRIHDGSAVPWLFGVATNLCRNVNRGRRRHLRAMARLASDGAAPDHAGHADHVDHADRVADRLDAERGMRRVLDAVSRLPQRERDVLALVAWSGLSYEAAATALDIPIGTVRSRLSRARARLATFSGEGHLS